MSLSITEKFLSSNNLNRVLDTVVLKVLEQTNINLKENNMSTNKQFQKMAQIVNNKFINNVSTIDELNNKLLSNSVNHFIGVINKKKLSRKTSNVPVKNTTNNYNVKNVPEIIGESLPFVNNLNDSDDNNIDDKLKQYTSNREQLILNYNNTAMNDNPYAELEDTENNLRRGELKNQDQLNDENNKLNELFKKQTSIIEKPLITQSMNEDMFNYLQQNQYKTQPKFYEKSNYIIINSIDRDWLNGPIENNRYNFNIKFGNRESGALIKKLYRNVTSVELVNCFLPNDNVLIPFDTRPYIDVLSYPYLVLKIPELTNVFSGTNNSTDNAFSIIIYDKKHDSKVLSSDFVSSMVNGSPNTQFYNEYNKSYYKYIPAYFEKKEFYNQPLATLTSMTINIVNPNNENINVMPDVLSIADVAYTNTLSNIIENTTFEYDSTNSYPNDAERDDRRYIRIETSSPFSSKLYRLGDNIKIRGITTTNSADDALVSYLNRDEGHYIINFDRTNYTKGQNQGFTSNIYISPPGSLNNDYELDANTYINSIDDDTKMSFINAKLINTNLQTHYLFKINTREADVTTVNMSQNI